MKIDMHCHTKEGSPDGSIPIEEYIRKLKSLGFGGMVVTDHDSYGGYRVWKETIRGKRHRDFVVFKGIEYDTIDAGHIIVIMPEYLKLRILEMRGLPVNMLIDIVHRYGGILGPAHPCGSKYMSYENSLRARQVSTMMKFDFVEAFNACETRESNFEAECLARVYGKPGTGGSDAHRIACVGLAWTEIPDSIRHESQLINYIKSGGTVKCGGRYYGHTTKDRIGPFNRILVEMFWFYNKFTGWSKIMKRRKEMRKPTLSLATDQPRRRDE
ncbi:hypothetical protein SAMN06296386_103195 [Lachnospiraceae bacterium]|nr:hypothetical protein SAMN06296386_103195 [Lachnospiraceae bacterium]